MTRTITAPMEQPMRGEKQVDYDRINRALAENIPSMLTMGEVREITGFSKSKIHNWIEEGLFPKPIGYEMDRRVRFTWPSPIIREWCVTNGVPTVFGKAA